MSFVQPQALDDSTRAQVHALADAIELRDGEPPLSDQALSRLGSAAVSHVLARDERGHLAGYAQSDGTSAELAGDAPTAVALLERVELGDPARICWCWSHGRRSPLTTLLPERGYQATRTLYQLRRSLSEPLPDAPLRDNITVRTFEPGRDEPQWLEVNAAAFAGHPEQGRWTIEDLHAREAERWFDPAGFLLAVRGDQMLGFHWTKVHSDGMGEVYVLGVHPAAQGLGLGPALLVSGLRSLAERRCPEVLLYVDGDNAGAHRLYERMGFAEHDRDVQWRGR